MEYVWNLSKHCHIKKMSYLTCVNEYTNFARVQDTRSVESMLGAPPRKSEWKGDVLRQQPEVGRAAHFHYSSKRDIPRKTGFMERIGYITLTPELEILPEGKQNSPKKAQVWKVIFHHERMSYFTKQETLETANPLPDMKTEENCSNVPLCVSNLCTNPFIEEGGSEGGNANGVPPNEEAEETIIETGERERDDIGNTHTKRSSESEQIPIPICDELLKIATAPPTEEPDQTTPTRANYAEAKGAVKVLNGEYSHG